jgi:choline-glycine betaine transporter
VHEFILGVVLTAMSIGPLIAGGLKALRAISIATAFPFVMIAAVVSAVRGLARHAGAPHVGDEDFEAE